MEQIFMLLRGVTCHSSNCPHIIPDGVCDPGTPWWNEILHHFLLVEANKIQIYPGLEISKVVFIQSFILREILQIQIEVFLGLQGTTFLPSPLPRLGGFAEETISHRL